jgi:hypothetical protein
MPPTERYGMRGQSAFVTGAGFGIFLVALGQNSLSVAAMAFLVTGIGIALYTAELHRRGY